MIEGWYTEYPKTLYCCIGLVVSGIGIMVFVICREMCRKSRLAPMNPGPLERRNALEMNPLLPYIDDDNQRAPQEPAGSGLRLTPGPDRAVPQHPQEAVPERGGEPVEQVVKERREEHQPQVVEPKREEKPELVKKIITEQRQVADPGKEEQQVDNPDWMGPDEQTRWRETDTEISDGAAASVSKTQEERKDAVIAEKEDEELEKMGPPLFGEEEPREEAQERDQAGAKAAPENPEDRQEAVIPEEADEELERMGPPLFGVEELEEEARDEDEERFSEMVPLL